MLPAPGAANAREADLSFPIHFVFARHPQYAHDPWGNLGLLQGPLHSRPYHHREGLSGGRPWCSPAQVTSEEPLVPTPPFPAALDAPERRRESPRLGLLRR